MRNHCLLQFVLSAIWQGMASGLAPADTLTKLGGVGGALASHAEALYQALPEPEQQIARRAFLGIVQLGEGAKDTRRRVPVAKLVAMDKPGQVRAVLNRFSQPERRLVTLSSEAGKPVAEITHEALFSHCHGPEDPGKDPAREQTGFFAEDDPDSAR